MEKMILPMQEQTSIEVAPRLDRSNSRYYFRLVGLNEPSVRNR